MPLELLHWVGPAMLGAPPPPAARRIATAEVVGGRVTMADTRLVVTVVGVPPGPTYSTVATLSIEVPAGVTVCARAGSDISNRPASAQPARRAIHAPIDTPRAGRLFAAPPALCITVCEDLLCIDQLLIVTVNRTVAVPLFAATEPASTTTRGVGAAW